MELITFATGPTSSSSRAELLGLNAALFSGLPFFAALDSAVILRTAQQIIDHLSSHSNLSRHRARLPQSVADLPVIPTLRKQLAFMPNSDHWLIFWRAIVKRCAHGIRLKQTKGHALDPQNRKWLADHPEVRTEALHNKRADRLADEAREFYFHSNVRRLSALLIERHQQYILFVRAIMAIIGRVHIFSQELRRAQATVGQHPDRSIPTIFMFKPSLRWFACQMLPEHVVSLRHKACFGCYCLRLCKVIDVLGSLCTCRGRLGSHGWNCFSSALRWLTIL